MHNCGHDRYVMNLILRMMKTRTLIPTELKVKKTTPWKLVDMGLVDVSSLYQ